MCSESEADQGPPTKKLAIVGKGGSGKTVLAALLTRVFSERGLLVLAVDLDANPGLAIALGIPAYDIALPDSAIERQPDVPYGWGLARDLTAAEAVRRHAFQAAGKVAFLGYGNMAGVHTPLHHYLSAVRQIAAQFEEPGWVVVADLAAGPTNAYEGYATFASLALVTVEATPTSILTGRRLCEILSHDHVETAVVVTNVRSPDQVEKVSAELPVIGALPFDPDIRRLARAGSLRDLDSENPALSAIRTIVDALAF